MKRTGLFLVALVCMIMQSTTSFAGDDKFVPIEQLPTEVWFFVQENFPKTTISYATKDFELKGEKYEVRLTNGTKIKFDKKGHWDKVYCKSHNVPTPLIPTAIYKFVRAYYPTATIVKIDKERYGYKVELSNDIELKFNKSGLLISIDD